MLMQTLSNRVANRCAQLGFKILARPNCRRFSLSTIMAKPISAADFQALRNDPKAIYHHVDVRNLPELKDDGFIPNSTLVPLPSLAKHHLPENLSTKIVFSCRSGGRSMTAAKKAAEWGYTDVDSLDGGFNNWKALSLPTATGFPGQPFVKMFYDATTGTCQYLVADEVSKEAAIIDPALNLNVTDCCISYEPADAILKFVFEHGYQVKWILETHAHADHLTASQYLKAQLGNSPKVAIGEKIAEVKETFSKLYSISVPENEFDHLFKANETFQLGSLECKVLHVPGHTPDHVCYLIGESAFVGDSIFMPDSGSARCDFPGGSAEDLFEAIRNTLFGLPDFTRIFVGHDYMPEGRPLLFQSTVEDQKKRNKHLQLGISHEEFIKMRHERDATLSNPKLLYYSMIVNIRAGHLPAQSQLFPEKVLFYLPVKVAEKTLLTKLQPSKNC